MPTQHFPACVYTHFGKWLEIATMFIGSMKKSFVTRFDSLLSLQREQQWNYFWLMIMVFSFSGALYLQLSSTHGPKSPKPVKLTRVASTSTEQVDSKQAPVPTGGISTPLAHVENPQVDRRRASTYWTGTEMPQTPTNAFQNPASGICTAVDEPHGTSTSIFGPTQTRTGRVSTPGYQTPYASAFATGDFSVLARGAPDLYATLQQTGMLNQDGTPTKKMLVERKDLPWENHASAATSSREQDKESEYEGDSSDEDEDDADYEVDI